ncbi:peptidase [Candidatus Endobugula sertula]|uniref:Peptidase n=1 Tax=Candidatus Endobugula sertula TaxID=62101 RepID=A0A1D2QT95_9GAMM|nr:peptidase [Candidatus Endobugula sertula]
MSSLLEWQLLGQNEDHLQTLPDHQGVRMHQGVIAPLMTLIQHARQAGFQLRVTSGFRSFERQLGIWNDKCRGLRAVLDSRGDELDIHSLSSLEKVMAILRWSALPGASRHHWGTDCDIYDAAAVSKDYQPQLHPNEYTGSGPFAPMIEWLSKYLQQPDSLAFFRPYLHDHDGVAPELWHLSYSPVSSEYEQHLSLSLIREQLNNLQIIEEKSTLLENLGIIYARFIRMPS